MSQPYNKAARAAKARERVALDLHLAGLTYAQIAAELGYADRGSAHRAVMRCMARDYPASEVADARQREEARLERAHQAVWPRVLLGDLKAIETMLKIHDRRARLLGLLAPLRVEQIDPETDARIRQLREWLEEQDVYVPGSALDDRL